uniref:Uncharacterized protein n=1 Tax=Meloidogyne enterolobii TaxID=390850 RepID=A0A6V7VJI9_MELEN|nr:unnamed protein product [Meloidogyne enterolobii]
MDFLNFYFNYNQLIKNACVKLNKKFFRVWIRTRDLPRSCSLHHYRLNHIKHFF